MNLDHRYKYECDSFRLLIDEFERQAEEYNLKNERYINEVTVHDSNEYQSPRYISNYKAILTSSIITEAQALLDFFLPVVVNYLAKIKNINISPFDKSWKNGNILCWTKFVLKRELGLKYDFSRGPYCKLKEFYKVRNDHIHYGGYLSSDKNRSLLKGKDGISVCEFTDLYNVDFSYCRIVINDIEELFSGVYRCI